MTAGSEQLAVRSYRSCFTLERRIHRIDRWRLPVPYGIPLRSMGYAAAALLAILAVSKLPVTASALGGLHPAIRLVVLPCVAALMLTRLEVDGRPAHAHLRALGRFYTSARVTRLGRWSVDSKVGYLGELWIASDAQGVSLPRVRIDGPCRVETRCPVRVHRQFRRIAVRAKGDSDPETREIVVPERARVVTR